MTQYKPFIRTANYYETDKMKVVHHSNYIRWLEECRMDLLKQIDFDYPGLEDSGILMPVLKVECDFQTPTKFNETVMIIPRLDKYTGVRLYISYRIVNPETNEVHNIAKTEHCFIDEEFKPVMIKRVRPDIHELLKSIENIDLA